MQSLLLFCVPERRLAEHTEAHVTPENEYGGLFCGFLGVSADSKPIPGLEGNGMPPLPSCCGSQAIREFHEDETLYDRPCTQIQELRIAARSRA